MKNNDDIITETVLKWIILVLFLFIVAHFGFISVRYVSGHSGT